mmetsp:Transcript_4738/g.7202  ORF Transcript_4738/g.7202 Transcript_4738/m.7202 type:complete len:755 (+) Transcript_4738:143-2407(+)|eukprot:CAMPEP_0195289216 /NCGR_PEP_ID=MMETSP0707-20130614/5585_1 /TAXON_ID=33640 /ORGANISM="Asterionellopsis glacialis, Strain CCMP134" /LENGTH=754 /DNA_ID=CAMNT_0040349195 /DNA_START=133 /DNA_END=2397 /DNA_ORIENTATION=+
MGRWRRPKKSSYRRKDSTTSDSSGLVSSTTGDDDESSDTNLTPKRKNTSQSKQRPGVFSEVDKERLTAYLTAYLHGAERVCFPDDANENSPEHPTNEYDKEWTDDEHVIIAGKHVCPALTNENLALPFLSLPATFTSKQRRSIHELCVDIGLFHCGAGHGDDRRIVMSIHKDGFSHVNDLEDAPVNLIPIRECRPWYYRSDHPPLVGNCGDDSTPAFSPDNTNDTHMFVQDATRRGKETIERLIDQPGLCLRDAHDGIDFEQIINEDLSSVDPPTLGCDDTWMLVDTADKMRQCVQDLRDAQPSEIGFDLEMYQKSKYMQITCLLQLTSDVGKDYVIDVLASGVWDCVPLLSPLFADASICKIGHAIGGMDIPSLHRDFGIFVVNAFDTYEAAKILRLKRHGLASVCKHYGLSNSDEYELLKETYQRTDWRQRPLTERMIQYGRSDVHYLVKLRKLMIRDLTRKKLWDTAGSMQQEEARIVANALTATLRSIKHAEGDAAEGGEEFGDAFDNATAGSSTSNEDGYFTAGSDEDESKPQIQSIYGAKDLRMQSSLMRLITTSQQRCLDLWKGKAENPYKCHALVQIMKRAATTGKIEWTHFHMELYEQLVAWRTSVAQREGVLVDFVCSLDFLVSVANKRPTCIWSLKRIAYFLPGLLEENGTSSFGYADELLSIVQKALTKVTGETVFPQVPSYQDRRIRSNDLSDVNGEPKYPRSTSSFPSENSNSVFVGIAVTLVLTVGTMVVVTAMRGKKK